MDDAATLVYIAVDVAEQCALEKRAEEVAATLEYKPVEGIALSTPLK